MPPCPFFALCHCGDVPYVAEQRQANALVRIHCSPIRTQLMLYGRFEGRQALFDFYLSQTDDGCVELRARVAWDTFSQAVACS